LCALLVNSVRLRSLNLVVDFLALSFTILESSYVAPTIFGVQKLYMRQNLVHN
jgi:hypothetical protein